jgi:hypothetical protein
MISVSPLSGIKNVTSFTFQISPSSANPIINWGDDSFSYSNTATHIYSGIGVYDIYGGTCSATSAFQLSVYSGNFFTDKILVTSIATSSIVSNIHTFTINLSSRNETNTVVLYSSGSDSIPYSDTRSFWTHLQPEWSFTYNDKNISELSMTGSPVYSGTHILGYSATSSVNYSDDMPGHRNLWFTVKQTEKNVPINSRVYSTVQHSICASIPDKLFITADGINDINRIQWAEMDNPYIISVGSSVNSATNILHYVSGNLIDIKFISDCFGVDTTSFISPLCAISLMNDINCEKTGGYILTDFNLPLSALPPVTISNNIDSCNPEYEKLEYSRSRNAPRNITLSAVGIFEYQGITYTLSGISEPFDIMALENRHEFFRKGEDINVYDILQQSLPFDITQHSNFNIYLNAVAGSGDSLGKIYDKIHNFSDDHSDIDICTIDTLMDKSIMLDDPLDDFGLELPEELKRLFNFSTLPLQKLIGSRCVCNTNFVGCGGCANTNICTICKFDKRDNLGDRLTTGDYITAGTTILYKENGGTIFNFLTVSPQDTDIFKLQTLSAEPFSTRGISNYCFYKWDKTPQNNPVESVINYKDPRNNLCTSLSSNDDWYADNGIIEEMFNYILTKNLIDN